MEKTEKRIITILLLGLLFALLALVSSILYTEDWVPISAMPILGMQQLSNQGPAAHPAAVPQGNPPVLMGLGDFRREKKMSVLYLGRVKEEDVVKGAVDAASLIHVCLTYSCTTSCKFSRRCEGVAKDIAVVTSYRRRLFGDEECKVVPSVRNKYLFNMLDDNKIPHPTHSSWHV